MQRTDPTTFDQMQTSSPAGCRSDELKSPYSSLIPQTPLPTERAEGLNISWHEDPDVKDVLASIAANPPKRESYRDWSRSSRGKSTYYHYTGTRVRFLEETRTAYLAAALKSSDETGDRSIFERANNTPSVEDLISDCWAEKVAA